MMYIWIEIAQLIKGLQLKSWTFLESAGKADSPGHLTFNCGVHIIVAIQRMVKREFFSKKSYNLFFEFDTIICTPQLKVKIQQNNLY